MKRYFICVESIIEKSRILCSVFENTFNIFLILLGTFSKACYYYRCKFIFLNIIHLLTVFYFINNLKINNLKFCIYIETLY